VRQKVAAIGAFCSALVVRPRCLVRGSRVRLVQYVLSTRVRRRKENTVRSSSSNVCGGTAKVTNRKPGGMEMGGNRAGRNSTAAFLPPRPSNQRRRTRVKAPGR